MGAALLLTRRDSARVMALRTPLSRLYQIGLVADDGHAATAFPIKACGKSPACNDHLPIRPSRSWIA